MTFLLTCYGLNSVFVLVTLASNLQFMLYVTWLSWHETLRNALWHSVFHTNSYCINDFASDVLGLLCFNSKENLIYASTLNLHCTEVGARPVP